MLITDLPSVTQSYKSAADAVAHAITYLEALLAERWKAIKGESQTYNLMRRDCPYAIHRTEVDGTFILVNRNYKPIGSNIETGSTHVRYEDCPSLHVRLTPGQMRSVGCDSENYLFGGRVKSPWDSRQDAEIYLEKLRGLHGALMG